MIFQIIPEETSQLISLMFYVVLLIVYITVAVKFFAAHSKNKENKVNLPLAIMFVFLSISRIFFLLYDYYFTGFETALKDEYIIVWKIGITFLLIGFGVLLYIVSGLLLKGWKKYIVVAGYLIFPVFILISDTVAGAQNWVTPGFVFWAVIPLGYLYIAKQSTGDIRKKALYVVFGVMFYLLSYLLLAEFVTDPLAAALPIYKYDIHTLSTVGKLISVLLISKGF
ncbi:MAG: hypothetical protein GY870_01495 [archaeon]|nr:hypothetical protein [archaeon]